MTSNDEQNPLQEIKDKNLESIGQLNEVLNKTLGNKFGRAIGAGFSIFTEYFLYALALCVLVFIFIMDKVSPFYLLEQMSTSMEVQKVISPVMIQDFAVVVKVIIGLVAFLIFMYGTSLRKIRKYKDSIRASVVELKDVRDDIIGNNKRIDELNELSDKMMASANMMAYESKVEKIPNDNK